MHKRTIRLPYSNRTIIITILAALGAGVGIYYGISAYLINEAKKDVRDVLLTHRGLHHYIQRDMHPEFYRARNINKIEKDYYNPVILSSSYIVRVLDKYYNEERKKMGLAGVFYKLATDNPRNPRNRATDFESKLLAMFNADRNIQEYQTTIHKPDGHYLVYAVPFLETTKACLKCHGEREDAPQGLQTLYPGEGGYHDKVGNIRAIESIIVPIDKQMMTGYAITGSLSAGMTMVLLLILFNNKLRDKVDIKTNELLTEIEIRKKTELRISKTLEEKEILLKEIHHRVKNNLAIITSILSMRSMFIKDEENKNIFKDCQQRIRTMAIVHEKLYHSKNLENINLREYLTDLVTDIINAYKDEADNLSLTSDIKELSLSIDTLIPLGLIINEIVVNSIKHAFSSVENPQIFIDCKIDDSGKTCLHISDNGCGFSQYDPLMNPDSLGLEMIKALLLQINGNYEVDTTNGTHYTIIIGG